MLLQGLYSTKWFLWKEWSWQLEFKKWDFLNLEKSAFYKINRLPSGKIVEYPCALVDYLDFFVIIITLKELLQ